MSSAVQPAAPPPAAPEAPATPAPLTTEKIQADLKAYLTTPATKPEPAAVAPASPPAAPAPPAVEPAPVPPGADPDDEDAARAEWPESAQKRVDKLFARRKEAEAQREAEKQRADNAEAELAKLKGQTPPKPDESSQRSEPAQPAERFDDVPEVKAAREEQAKHAEVFETSQKWLAVLSDPERTREEVEAVYAGLKERGADVTGQAEPVVREFLGKVISKSMLNHSNAAVKVQALVSEAERNVGVEQQRWTAYTHAVMPDLFKEGTPENTEAKQVIAENPWIADRPDRDWVVASIVHGNRALLGIAKRATQQRAAPTTTTTAPPPAAPPSAVLPGAPGSLPPATPPVVTSEQLKEKVFKGGNEHEQAAWVKSLF